MEEALYWMWFQQVFGVGTRRAEEVLSRVGHPRKLYEMDRINLARLGIFSQKELSLLGNTTLDQARKNAAEARRLGFEILTPEDLKYPNLLKNIYSCPLVLYVEGELPDLSQQLPIAMVGTRNFTEYGKRVGKTLSGDLARAGAVERQSLCWAVVSMWTTPGRTATFTGSSPKTGQSSVNIPRARRPTPAISPAATGLSPASPKGSWWWKRGSAAAL